MNSFGNSNPLHAAVVAVALCLPMAASATLGQPIDNSAAATSSTAVTNKAKLRIAARGNYSVQESQTEVGTVIREFIGADGVVFGVAWQGPLLPNFKDLLGSYFEPYKRQQSAQTNQGIRAKRVAVQEGDLVMESAGRMRAFKGRAYLKSLLPAGVDPMDVQ